MRTKTSSNTDADLVKATQCGDDQAFSALVNRHRGLVYATAFRALGDRDEAEDAAQESFVAAYRHLENLGDAGKFPPWLYAISLNVIRKRLRRQKLVHRGLVRLAADTGRPEEYAALEADASTTGHVHRALTSLAPSDRTVMTLYYLIGLSQKRIAETLEIPEGTVKSRLHRSRHQLKERLKAMNHENETGPDEDYGRAVIGGMRGAIPWRKLLQPEGTEGWRARGSGTVEGWERTGNALVGNEGSTAPLITGEADWHSYELSLLVTPISGGNAQVFFRISEDEGSFYVLDFLLGWQAVAISRVDGGDLTKLSVVNFPIEHGQEYDLQIAARESSLTSYVDGKLINQVTDSAYPAGPLALNIWECSTAFRDPRIRLLH